MVRSGGRKRNLEIRDRTGRDEAGTYPRKKKPRFRSTDRDN